MQEMAVGGRGAGGGRRAKRTPSLANVNRRDKAIEKGDGSDVIRNSNSTKDEVIPKSSSVNIF